MLNPEFVTVVADGREFAGWEDVSIRYAMKEATRSFSLSTTEQVGQWNFPPGTKIEIYANADLVLKGYVNRYSPNGSKTAHSVTIEGRSTSQDLVDCAAVHPKGFEKDMDPAELGQKLDHFGVGVKADVPLRKEPYLQIYQGETAFQAIERYLRNQGAALKGEADGSVTATNASAAKRHKGILWEGANIIDYSADLSDDRRFSETTVKGQGRHGTKPEHLRIKETVLDEIVKRYRPRLIVAETDTDAARAKERATHEKERSASESVKANVTTQGWRDDAGELWDTNRLIYTYSPILMHLDQDMLIESVSLTQSKGAGSKAALSLVDPQGYKGAAQPHSGSDQAWSQG